MYIFQSVSQHCKAQFEQGGFIARKTAGYAKINLIQYKQTYSPPLRCRMNYEYLMC